MENKKFEKRFLLFVIGQFFILIGTLNIGANFKVLPSWFDNFLFAIIIGIVLFHFSLVRLYKINRNFLRSYIALIVYTILVLLVDVCSRSKDDFYLAWSRGLETSVDFIACVLYVYFFLGTSDYFKDDSLDKGKKQSKTTAIVLIVLFIIERTLAFIASLNITKQNLVLFSICRFGSWGMQFVIHIYVFVILLTIFVFVKKRKKEALTDEETA